MYARALADRSRFAPCQTLVSLIGFPSVIVVHYNIGSGTKSHIRASVPMSGN